MGLNILKGYLWSDYMIENIDEETYLFKSKVNAKDIDFIAKLIVRWCQCKSRDLIV